RPQYVVPLALHVTSLSGRGVVGTGRRHGRPDSSTRPLGPARREPGVAIRLPPSTASSVAQGSDGSAGAGRAADRVGDQPADHVGVDVGVRPPVLQPALLVLGHLPRDADGGAAVGRAVAELRVVLGLVGAGEAELDTDAVVLDVLLDVLPEGLATGDDGVPAAVPANLLGREVGVAAGAVPVTEHRLGFESGEHAEVLGDAEEQPAGGPQLVADGRRRQDAHLELPLAHHHLGVGALDGEAGLDTGGGVPLDDLPARHLVAADPAVVGALWRRVAVDRPAQRAALLEEGVLLLHPEPRLVGGVLLGHRRTGGPGVGGVRGEVGEKDLAHHQLVVGAAEGVRADEHRVEHAVGVVASGLVGAGAVEAPDTGLLAVRDDLGLAPDQRGRLGA